MAVVDQKDTEYDRLVASVNYRKKGCKRNVSVEGGYTLAKKRRAGLTSSTDLVAIAGGDEIHGSIKDRHLVTKYEHRSGADQHRVSIL